MKLDLIMVMTLLALGGAMQAAAQIPLTQVNGSGLQCSTAQLDSCNQRLEREFSKTHPGIVRRELGGLLSAKLTSGEWLTIDRECGLCAFAVDAAQGPRYLAVLSFGEEDMYWRLLDRETGQVTRTEGYPLFSPDGRRIVSGERDEMNSHALDIYDVTANGPIRVFRGIMPDEPWAPQRLCWIDNTTIGYERVAPTGSHDGPGAPETLALRDGKWRIEPGGPRCAATS